MSDLAEEAVLRAIESMRENLAEDELSVDDIARAAMYSKFHLTRQFRKVTGVSPGRFLTALRLQEAKRLLVSSTMTVTEISDRVGYASPGTFGTRFTQCVGLPPTDFRRLGGVRSRIPVDHRRHLDLRRHTTIHGRVSRCPGEPGLIFVGLFADQIPQGRPVSCTVLTRPGEFVLTDVPEGSWHLLAHSVPPGCEGVLPGDQDNLSVASCGPIEVRPGRLGTRVFELPLRPIRVVDPPVLMALLDIRSFALRKAA